MTEQEYAKAKQECHEQMSSISTFGGLKIERKGFWLWISGNTRQHHVALKGAGFNFAPKKKLWFWKPKWVGSVDKGKIAEYIKDTEVVLTEEVAV